MFVYGRFDPRRPHEPYALQWLVSARGTSLPAGFDNAGSMSMGPNTREGAGLLHSR